MPREACSKATGDHKCSVKKGIYDPNEARGLIEQRRNGQPLPCYAPMGKLIDAEVFMPSQGTRGNRVNTRKTCQESP